MTKFRVMGGKRLHGEVEISGAKNAAVAILPAVVLAEDVCCIENLPNISDVSLSLEILEALGAVVRRIDASTVEIDPRTIRSHVVPNNLASRMRASYYFIGALLGRFGVAQVPMPGGCNFGVRPIDLHLKGFSALGAATTQLEQMVIEVSADKLLGNSIYMDKVSVGATMNIMLAAVKARGTTVIENAAKEPHVVDLAIFLNALGADVRGAGTDNIKIHGVEHLHGATYGIIPDQIEAGTYMAAAVATGGDVLVKNVTPKHLDSITAKLAEMGATVEKYDDAVYIAAGESILPCPVKTEPHPGFPTDMQPQFGVLLSLAKGTSIITEGVWENRFWYTEELRRMGAHIQVDGKLAIFEGVPRLKGATVKALDLRAGAAMVIAALAAEGITEIENIHFIQRGYEDIVEKLRALGADIAEVDVSD